jgi:hypothetical protein
MHSRELKAAGEPDERIFTVAAWRESPYFTDAERAALALTEAATRLADRSDPVPDEVWEEAARHYDEPALAAIVIAIAAINAWNRINATTCRSPASGSTSGWPPASPPATPPERRRQRKAASLIMLGERAGGADLAGCRQPIECPPVGRS